MPRVGSMGGVGGVLAERALLLSLRQVRLFLSYQNVLKAHDRVAADSE